MKISLAWLKTWLTHDIAQDDVVNQLTMAGLEVDDVTPVAGDFSNLVVGQVESCEPHPNADRLTVCQVNIGSDTLSIVCGAKNVRAGQRVAVACIGGHVGELKIKKSKLRGVESFGMLCSKKELGLAETSDGIMVLDDHLPLGQDIREALELNDVTIDIDLTPNRGDCLSAEGLAREFCALEGSTFTPQPVAHQTATQETTLPVEVEATSACGQYLGRVISNVDMTQPSPRWITERLRRCGIRSIDPIVDITNYVMLELGQPMHAFDRANIQGGIVVRHAKPQESLTLLDGQTINLEPDCLVIADHAQCLALAGVMGGASSGVSANTKEIVLESAYFSPAAIAGRARRYGLHTDSSHRFERGVDPSLQRRAIERATELLLDIVGGSAGPVIEVMDPEQLPQARTIALRVARVHRVLGISLDAASIEQCLVRLGFTCQPSDEGFLVQVQPHRFDIHLEIDLIEEIARIHGYANLPNALPSTTLQMIQSSETRISLNALRDVLVNDGFNEAISYAFVAPTLQQLITPNEKALALVNPLSPELSEMRTTLWTGLLHTLQYNQHRQAQRVRLFESGLRFLVRDKLHQIPSIAGVIAGQHHPMQWAKANRQVDFYDLKNTIEKCLSLSGQAKRAEFIPAQHPALHPGQCAEIILGQPIGICGRLHPKLESQLDLKGPVYVFELDLTAFNQAVLPRYQEISKFPAIRRDLAIVVDNAVPAAALLAQIESLGGAELTQVQIFDRYQGAGIESGQKSIALEITLQDRHRTLTDDEVSATINKIINGLKESLGATLRE